MIKNKYWETFVGIMIWLVILSFVVLSIVSIVWFNYDTSDRYKTMSEEAIIEINSDNIIKKLDIDNLDPWDEFYIYKDITNKEFKIMTWSTNEEYMYINSLWNKKDDISDLREKTYIRKFAVQDDLLKNVTYPNELPNWVFHYDAQDPDGDWNDLNNPSDWQEVSRWVDKFSWYDWYLTWVISRWSTINASWAFYKLDWINWKPSLKFDSSLYSSYTIDNQVPINIDLFEEKSFATVIKTWDDVQRSQIFFNQWWTARWYSFMVHSWSIWFWAYNIAGTEWESWHKTKNVNIWQAFPNTVYFLVVVQDSSWWDWDINNTLSIYSNWKLFSFQNNINPQRWHWSWVWIWAVNDEIKRASDFTLVDNWFFDDSAVTWQIWNPLTTYYYWYKSDFLDWEIWELIQWNYAMTQEEVIWLQNYFAKKWWFDFIDVPKLNVVSKEVRLKVPE